MRLALITLACLGALGAATAPAAADGCGDASAITESFINNRFNRSVSPDPDACYWQAMRVSIFNNNPVVMTAGEPRVVTGSSLNHDTTSPVDLGTAGWLGTTDSKDRLARGEVLAWIDGQRVEVLTSGQPRKWESFIDPDADSIIFTCDEYFANLNLECEDGNGNPCPSETREPEENCWAVSYGVDLSTLEVGTHTFNAVFYGSYGNGPADYPSTLLEITKVIDVLP
jgi:hypothetical protein